VDGLILAASMLILDANRRHQPRTTTGALVPSLPASWATIGANLAHSLGHGPVGALVSA
jgi:hypothetical protein